MVPSSAVAVPPTLTEQGRLFDAQGASVTARLSLSFSLYESDAGDALVWSETQSVELDDGYFAVELGSVESLPASVFGGAALYLGMRVDGDEEMRPLQRLTSVPYALVAETAQNPNGVFVGSIQVVNAAGEWVGEAGLGGQGPPGATGPAGAVGPAGDPGPAGASGVVGPAGPAGARGPAGLAGPAGAEGPAGPAGAAGPRGLAGPAGATGPRGLTGPAGPSGAEGSLTCNIAFDDVSIAALSQRDVRLSCPAGTTMSTGGCLVSSADANLSQIELVSNGPIGPNSWSCRWVNNSNAPFVASTRALCCTL